MEYVELNFVGIIVSLIIIIKCNRFNKFLQLIHDFKIKNLFFNCKTKFFCINSKFMNSFDIKE